MVAKDQGTRISLCMIVRNEEFFLPEALTSARPYVDEVIVTDTGSTDNTVSIAQTLGATVTYHSTDDLAEARNTGLDTATGDWVLVLDADERMTPEDFQRLRQMTKGQTDAWQLPIYSYFGDGLWTVLPVARFFRRDKSIRWSKALHETVDPSLKQHSKQQRKSEVIIHHVEIDGQDRSLAKRHRNITRIEQYLQHNPADARYHCFLGIEFFALGDIQHALDECQIALNIAPEKPFILRQLGGLFLAVGDYPKAEEYFRRAFLAKPNDERVCLGLARVAHILGYTERALDYLDRAMSTDRGAHNLINKALLLLEQGEAGKANELFTQALRLNPFLLDERIYRSKQAYSVYAQESVLLDAYTRIEDLQSFWRNIYSNLT